ncbi:MAG: ATP-binding cassette domain-containing protein, partial [Bacteroidia bacterium]|nr:ATP-binding cassette domain-containing protein [Bacteroidia bacterium]
MSETILKALMRLFAIIADVDKGDISTGSHSYVETYLRKFLNEESVGQYLDIFNHYLKVHHKEQSQDDPSKSIKHTASDSVKVLTLCHQINEELRQNQKVLVLIQLLEFVAHNIEITKDEMEFIETVASAFNISRNEYENCRAFILDSYKDIPEKENVLIINSKEKVPDEGNKHFYVANLSGIIIFLFIKSTNTFIFKYFGDDNLSLNGHDIIVRRAYTFDTGASIRSSRMNTIYYSDITNQFLQIKFKTNLVLTAENVSFQFKNSENGIINFNFSEETGELIGVMGGSGVGKSTLLHILIGNIIPDSGKITINGYDLNKDREKLEGIIGFIPQDDLLIEELTVFQNLYYNTKLCFDNLTNDEIRSKVEKVLKELDLYEIRNLKVGDVLNKFISGGQRKRLNIALELIREPSILFVDEPTSGLSSKDSFLVMDLLKELTLRGKLIIANIHQPSSDIYKMFDKLIILDKGGYSIFYGNPIDAVVHFKTISHHINALESECLKCGNVNPEQIFEIVEAKVVNEYGKLTSERKISPKTWYECCHKHVIKKIKPKKYTPELPENQFKVPGKFKQFKVFITRDILSKLSNTQYMLINFLEAP